MSETRLWKREEQRLEQRKGLTGRGLVGCFTLVVSSTLAYLAFRWLSTEFRLRRLFNVPNDWPQFVVDIAVFLIIFVLIQTVLAVLASIYWKLAGKDKKVGDMMDDLLAQWDDVDHGG